MSGAVAATEQAEPDHGSPAPDRQRGVKATLMEEKQTVKSQYRFASLVGVVAIVAAACSSSATPAPSAAASVAAPSAAASVAASTAPSAAASTAASTAPSAASSAAPLTGSLTVWEAYGASGSAEKDAFDDEHEKRQGAQENSRSDREFRKDTFHRPHLLSTCGNVRSMCRSS